MIKRMLGNSVCTYAITVALLTKSLKELKLNKSYT